MIDDFRLVLASPPDRDNLVVEIWHGSQMWAEVAQEADELTVEFYPKPGNQPWKFSFHDATQVIQMAKEKLLGGK